MSLYQAGWVFFIYSFAGWCSVVVYASICNKRFVNRGFLNGPVCPVYGLGVLIVYSLLNPLRHSVLLLFVGSALLTSALELATGVIMERLFGQKLWDYSGRRYNVLGYITPGFSFIWGAGCVLVIKFVQPLVMSFIDWIPRILGISLLVVFLAALAADLAVTLAGAVHIRQRINRLDLAAANLRELSDKMGELLSDGTIEIMEKIEQMQKELETGKQRYSELLGQGGFVQNRLTKAFPGLKTRFEYLSGSIGKEDRDESQNHK